MLASSAFDVEGKSARFVTARLSVGRLCKQLADKSEHPRISSRIASGRATYRTLVDIYYLVYILRSVNAGAFAFNEARFHYRITECGI